ncbi:hypothetical protein NYR97_07100 [Xanthomonas hydrangeae]|uniref:Uncharacterized protein n=1 Tax=Xanthomonas hydrangeae TaxID=2775159 RepID=A0AAU0BDI7_9XANT|nr:hypothetical protein [Xanthomonas hydrangeae]WOB51133.1 hypothetical protein NYR97_07100 [Xanthomonas hydrangeae]
MELGRLSPTAALIAAIRGETVRGRGQVAQASSINRKAETEAASVVKQAKSIAQLERQLMQIVRDLSSDDLPAVRRARPLLIRQVLLWEFGQTFREHSEWASIMRRIEAQLDANDPEGQAFAGLVRSLQRKA